MDGINHVNPLNGNLSKPLRRDIYSEPWIFERSFCNTTGNSPFQHFYNVQLTKGNCGSEKHVQVQLLSFKKYRWNQLVLENSCISVMYQLQWLWTKMWLSAMNMYAQMCIHIFFCNDLSINLSISKQMHNTHNIYDPYLSSSFPLFGVHHVRLGLPIPASETNLWSGERFLTDSCNPGGCNALRNKRNSRAKQTNSSAPVWIASHVAPILQ